MTDNRRPEQFRSIEEMQASTIGEVQILNGQIVLAEYDIDWTDLYDAEAARVRSILGDKAIDLQHVGSTSVPGLAAKPIIDMLLVVKDSSDELNYLPPLEADGYYLRVREPDWFEHRLIRSSHIDINMHVFSQGCVEVDRMLRFRDWLRSHDEDRLLYESTKRELAARNWLILQHYADAKSTVVRDIMSRAMPETVYED